MYKRYNVATINKLGVSFQIRHVIPDIEQIKYIQNDKNV